MKLSKFLIKNTTSNNFYENLIYNVNYRGYIFSLKVDKVLRVIEIINLTPDNNVPRKSATIFMSNPHIHSKELNLQNVGTPYQVIDISGITFLILNININNENFIASTMKVLILRSHIHNIPENIIEDLVITRLFHLSKPNFFGEEKES